MTGCRVTYPNHLLVGCAIVNFTAGCALALSSELLVLSSNSDCSTTATFEVVVSVHWQTPMEHINKLKKALEEHVETRPKDYKPGVRCLTHS